MTRLVRPFGRDAVLVECADAAEALALSGLARARPDVAGTVPGASSVLVRGTATAGAALVDWLADVCAEPVEETRAEVLHIVVRYDGPDLDGVARLWGCTPDDVVGWHIGQRWRVAFVGFAPGFGYLEPEDAARPTARLASPRTRVPAGSVGLAGPWSGIYPGDGPGGWRLIGRTEAPLWDLHRNPPALLRPGGRVRFSAADA